MSSSEDDFDPRSVKASQSAMKSIFTSDSRAAQQGNTSLRYEAKSKRGDPERPSANIGNASASGTTAAQCPVHAYRGDQYVGPCLAVVTVANNQPLVVLIDREKRPQSRVRVNRDLQFVQNPSDEKYASLYDPAIGQHWSLLFRSATECANFVFAAAAVLHFILLAEGPVESFQDLVPSQRPRAKQGWVVEVGLVVWLLQRIGQTSHYTIGKVVEEITNDAPRRMTIGGGEMMAGVEELLVGMGPGGKRLGFLNPKKTKSSGIGNPEIGPSDSVVVLIHCIHVEPGDLGGSMPQLGDSGSGEDRDEEVAPTKKKARRNVSQSDAVANAVSGATSRAPAAAITVPSGSPVTPQPQPQQAVSTTAPLIDQNTLVQTMLLQTLQMQQQLKEPSKQSSGIDVERSIDRLHSQIASLYEKIDRMDIDGKLQKNNEAIERIVKKAVGKMPANDVDIEDMAKDRDQLLAKIEHLKQRVEESTDNYHKALEAMGRYKDEVVAIRNDLAIERETSAARLKELQERKRLEVVDMDVRHRQQLERTKEQSYNDGKDVGYREGYAAGKLDATPLGALSSDELAQKLHAKEQELVEAESRYQQLLSRTYQERRDFADQVESLNSLIRRLEHRDDAKGRDSAELTNTMCKSFRRAMNSTYAAIEAQLNATERDTILIDDALAIVLATIKGESRALLNEIKQEAALAAAVEKKSSASTAASEAIEAYIGSTEGSQSYAAMRADMEACDHAQKQDAVQGEVHHIQGEIRNDNSTYRRYADEMRPQDDSGYVFNVALLPLPPPTSELAEEMEATIEANADLVHDDGEGEEGAPAADTNEVVEKTPHEHRLGEDDDW